MMPTTKRKYKFVWGESYSMFTLEAAIRIYIDARHVLGCTPRNFVITNQGRVDRAYYLEKDLQHAIEIGKKFFDPKVTVSHTEGCLKTETNFLHFQDTFNTLDVKTLSNKAITDLLDTYEKFFILFLAYYEVTTVPEYMQALEGALKKIVKNERIYEMLLRLPVLTVVEEDAIAFLALSLQNTITDIDIFHYISRFPYQTLNTYQKSEMIEHVKVELIKVRKDSKIMRRKTIDTIREEKKFLKKKQEKIFKQYSRFPQVKNFSKIIQNMGYWRFRMKNYWAGMEFLFVSLFKEIAKRLDTDLEILMWVYTTNDVRNALIKGKYLTKKEENVRKHSYTFLLWDGCLKFLTGRREEHFLDTYIRCKTKNVTELHGATAQGGFAKGPVRLVHVHDLKQFKKDRARFHDGDVLATTMTQINFVPLMKKASAILTEQGGITCHAAITSRELRKPCIVGVAHLMETLHDGDVVAVDADHGIVKIIMK